MAPSKRKPPVPRARALPKPCPALKARLPPKPRDAPQPRAPPKPRAPPEPRIRAPPKPRTPPTAAPQPKPAPIPRAPIARARVDAGDILPAGMARTTFSMVVEKDPRAALLSGVQQLLLRHNIHAHVDSPCLSGLPPKQSKTKKSAEARFELTITAMTADVNNALATSDLATDALVQGVCKTMADVVRRPIFYHTGNGKGESGVVNPDEKRSDAHLHVSVKYSEAGSAELHRGGGGTVKRRKRYFFSVENKTTSRHSWSTSLSPWSSPLSTSTTKSSVLMSLSTSSDSSLQTPTTPIAVHSPLLGLVFDKA